MPLSKNIQRNAVKTHVNVKMIDTFFFVSKVYATLQSYDYFEYIIYM